MLCALFLLFYLAFSSFFTYFDIYFYYFFFFFSIDFYYNIYIFLCRCYFSWANSANFFYITFYFSWLWPWLTNMSSAEFLYMTISSSMVNLVFFYSSFILFNVYNYLSTLFYFCYMDFNYFLGDYFGLTFLLFYYYFCLSFYFGFFGYYFLVTLGLLSFIFYFYLSGDCFTYFDCSACLFWLFF